MAERFFEDSNALDSLRHSDFDALSAYGEVIDNSLQAGASKISIRMNLSPPKSGYHQIQEMTFCDDGHGMDTATLQKCLKLGWSSRFNDRSGIGRFGVGMILGAIHEVRRVDVYSKTKGCLWKHTYIDLDEIEQGKLESIPEPEERDIPESYNDIAHPEHGTLVIWSRYDKQKKSGHKILEEAKHWIGRTFRYFIWDGIEIYLNGELVKAHDPLYTRTEKTNFPDDPLGEEYEDILIPWKIPDEVSYEGKKDTSEIKIKLSLLPEEFRPTQGSGGSVEAKKRRIEDNEGVSILRNRREVFYGTLPYWSTVRWDGKGNRTWAFSEIDRWWGCEIHFSADLDSAFSVKNIKRGAEPLPELKSAIKKMITPTRKTCTDEVQSVWLIAKEKAEDDKRAEEEKLGCGQHKSAEDVAKNTPTPKSKYNAGVSAKDAAAEILEKALDEKDENKRAVMKALFSSQPFTISDSSWKGSTFWDIYHAGGNSFLSYNKRHEFFSEIYRLMDGLEDKSIEPNEVARNVRVLIDLLLVSAAKAQALHDEESTIHRTGDFLEEYNQQWGMMLSAYVKNWLREQEE
jgi:hypothetical protein